MTAKKNSDPRKGKRTAALAEAATKAKATTKAKARTKTKATS